MFIIGISLIFTVGYLILIAINNGINNFPGTQINPQNLCLSNLFESYRYFPILSCFIYGLIFKHIKTNVLNPKAEFISLNTEFKQNAERV